MNNNALSCGATHTSSHLPAEQQVAASGRKKGPLAVVLVFAFLCVGLVWLLFSRPHKRIAHQEEQL